MTISSIQLLQRDLGRHKYKKLTKASLEDVLQGCDDLYNTLVWCLQQVFNWSTVQIEGDGGLVKIQCANLIENVWLDANASTGLYKKHKNKSIDLITGMFEAFDYSDEALVVLELLSSNGAAVLCVPALDYGALSKALSKYGDLNINAVFSTYDHRNKLSYPDQTHTLPANCKCLAVVITRKNTDLLYLWPEFNEVFLDYSKYCAADETADVIVKDLSQFFQGELTLTPQGDVYREIISADRVIVKHEDFQDVERFYTNSQMEEDKSFLSELPSIKLVDVCKCLAGDPLSITRFIGCIQPEGQFNMDGWNDYVTDSNGQDNDSNPTVDALFKSLKDDCEMTDFKPASHVEDFGQVFIVETYNNEPFSPYYKFILPHEWGLHSGDFKYWAYQDSAVSFSLLMLDPKVILDTYFEFFLESHIGKLSQTISLLDADNLYTAWEDIEIFLPVINEQKIIAESVSDANNLQDEIKKLKEQLILNPKKSQEVSQTLKDWLKRLDKLEISDKVLSLIKAGESDTLEFKETFGLDVKKQTKEKYIELMTLKTIAGFLNSKGGVLLIGVSDNGSYAGIMSELEKLHKKSKDKFLLHFKNIIKTSIGEEFYPYIDYQLVDVGGSVILYVNCKQSLTACFLNGEDFYVRTNPATDKLEGPTMVKYIQNHFTNE